MEFTIRDPRKKKRGKRAETTAQNICPLSHCLKEPGHCESLDCQQRVIEQTRSLDNEKFALGVSLNSRITESQRLYAEIQEECDLTSLDTGSMRSSLLAYKAGMQASGQNIDCKCSDCVNKQSRSICEVMAKRLAVVQDWLAALREYRSEYDIEEMQHRAKSTKYFSEGKYFKVMGSYRGHGAAAMRPRLQMQSTYNVEALTTNDMARRPLKGERRVKKTADFE